MNPTSNGNIQLKKKMKNQKNAATRYTVLLLYV